jgi:Zn-dependent peptidase ImmA (M78 family)/transcriptional regulator with XRE-family HTH domain
MDEAFITGDVLKWARERRNLSQAELAKIIKVTVRHIDDWESEATHPLFGKAESIAEKLKIPFGYFFLSTRPPDDVPLPDLRTLSETTSRTISLDAVEQINSVLRKQDWYREYALMEKKPPLNFVGSFSMDDSAEAVSASIARTLSINSALRGQVSSWTAYLSKLINRGEENGILVIRSGIVKSSTRRALSLDDFRGFAASDHHAPIVYINGKDSIAARIFTLIHEFAHLWLNKSGISNADGIDEDTTVALERFCNQIAAIVLVPMDEFSRAWQIHGQSPDPINRLAVTFRVSARVIARRALELGKITRTEFFARLEEIKSNEKPLKKRKGGDSSRNLVARNSAPLIDAIVRALRKGHIEYRDAAKVLGSGIQTVAKLADVKRTV